MASTMTFYGVIVYESERSKGEFKAFCRTKKLAARELLKYRDYDKDKPPKPDDRHIKQLELIVE